MAEIAEYKENTPAVISNNLSNDFIKFVDRTPATTRTYIINLRQFGKYLTANEIARPTREDIIRYRDTLTAEGLKPSTVTGYLNTVKEFFRWTAARGLYPNIADGIHAPKVDHSTHKKDALEPAEVLDIENSIQDRGAERIEAAGQAEKDTAGRVERANLQTLRLQAIYLLAVNAGLRTVEISRANIKDIETKGGQTYIWIYGKGHTEADTRKPLAREVAQAVFNYLDARTDAHTVNSPLFVSTGNRLRLWEKGKDENGNTVLIPVSEKDQRRIAPATIGQMLKKAMKEAGYNSDRLTAHSLRHTAGTCVLELTNNNVYETQRYMRHADPATTEIYLHNEIEKQEADTAERLYSYYHGQQDTQAADLEAAIKRLNPSQLAQLASIAAAMA